MIGENVKVDSTSLLFSGLTQEDASQLYELCACIVKGSANLDHPLFDLWCKAAGFDLRKGLLAHTTSFPQYGLLSLVEYYRQKTE